MSSIEVSLQEQLDPVEYFRSFCKNNIRPDGRTFSDYRQFSARTDIVKATNVYGSSQVQIGKTIVTCGINLMVGSPSMNEPSEGDIAIDVTLTPLCHSKFDQKGKHEDALTLESIIFDVLVRGKIINLEQLSILKGKYAYRLCLNIICLSNAGNMTDAMILAAMFALRDVRLPEAVIKKDTVEVNTDKTTSLTVVSSAVPVSVGIFEHGVYLVDPALSEEKILKGLVTCVVDTQDGSMRYLRQQKGGGLSFSQTQDVFGICSRTATTNVSLLSK